MDGIDHGGRPVTIVPSHQATGQEAFSLSDLEPPQISRAKEEKVTFQKFSFKSKIFR